ncbi:MAG: hypothetical protein CK425_04720 [Parachlamydia sp.]|nr:MAG: hypothetical protein CK425_04720 [Parachlamydia sp.]
MVVMMIIRLLLLLWISTQPFINENQGFAASTESQIVTRAAFDFGSGSVKLQVAEVDLSNNRIVKTLYAEKIPVDLSQDLSQSIDAKFSPEIQAEAVRVMTLLKNRAAAYQPEAYSGVATEAFRIAKNGQELIDSIREQVGIPLKIISQDEEAIVGFAAAVSTKGIAASEAVVWDIGGGSLQIVTQIGDSYEIFKANLGKVPMKNFIISELQCKDVNHTYSPNPISPEDGTLAIQFVKEQTGEIPAMILEKLADPKIVVLGIGAQPKSVRYPDRGYTSDDVYAQIQRGLNLSDQDILKMFDQDAIPAYVVSDLILVYGVMTTVGIENVQFIETVSGNSSGVMITPSYWEGI